MTKKPALVVLSDTRRVTSSELYSLVDTLSLEFNVTIIDFPQDESFTAESNIRAQTVFVEDCLRVRIRGRFHVLGIFGGTYVARRYALIHPDTVMSISTVDDKTSLAPDLRFARAQLTALEKKARRTHTTLTTLFDQAVAQL